MEVIMNDWIWAFSSSQFEEIPDEKSTSYSNMFLKTICNFSFPFFSLSLDLLVDEKLRTGVERGQFCLLDKFSAFLIKTP